jgi:hypothetical protein
MISALHQSCYKATVLLERRDLVALSGTEKIGLWWHLRICEACRKYEEQSRAIDRLMAARNTLPVDTVALEARILALMDR